MDFWKDDYLAWYLDRMRRGDDSINLNSSGVRPVEVDLSTLPPGGMWEWPSAFEARLGRWLDIPAEEVVFTPGGTGGNLLALLSLAPRGARLVLESPMYEPMVRQAYRLNDVVRLQRRFEDGWRLPLDQARQLITHDTRIIVLCEPCNPPGVYSAREDILELAAMADEKGAYLLINEVYRGFSDQPSLHGAAKNIVVVSSLSKLVGAYQYRLGWLSARPSVAARLREAHRNMGIPTAPAAAFGLKVMEKAEGIRLEAAAAAAAGLPVVDRWVKATPGLDWIPSQGPGFGTVELPEGMDDLAFAERLHDEHGVFLVAGSLFELPGTLRIAWQQSGERLPEGLDIVARVLAA